MDIFKEGILTSYYADSGVPTVVAIRKVTLSFFLYILVMTFALVAGGVAEDPTKYNKGIDYFRAICEILTLMFCCYQLGFEAQQLKK